ncbi:Uncharacterised protein [Yersinia enterocolitica]|nr:Uncharacterised protein [Yersinia enterocolitica]
MQGAVISADGSDVIRRQFQGGTRQRSAVVRTQRKGRVAQIHCAAKRAADRRAEIECRAGIIFRHIQGAAAGQCMVKQRDISQIQSGVGDIHRDITAHAIGVGQGDITAVGDLQHATASDGIGKGAAKAAQRQNILRPR